MKYKLVKVDELEELLQKAREVKRNERDEAYESGYDDATAEYEAQVEELEETVDEQKATIKSKNRKISELEAEVEVLKKNQTDARKLVESRIENETTSSELSSRQSRIYKREEALDKREEELNARETSEDDKRYKEGYADGVSDGVRKIGEITAADRKDAMDVAKISAASHSNSETVKAVLDGKVETSLKDKKAK
jgi:predicted RNase H-like nuclease (RuvC/YqgF family)